MECTREQALRFRHHQQRLDGRGPPDDSPVLDLGVQDTGMPAAARWALALRGCTVDDDRLLYAWTLRGAPHAYRRGEAAGVAAATAPYDDADAANRLGEAAKALEGAGIQAVDGIEVVAGHLHDIVTEPMVKGEVSTALTARLPDPYLLYCERCEAVHAHEQLFRVAALRGGLELAPGTSPPVLRRVDGWDGAAASVPRHLDPVRALLHLFGPTTPKLVAGFLDAPVRTVRRHWPDDTVEVEVDGERREVLEGDLDALRDPPAADGVRLLGSHDPWLQVRDRELLVPDRDRRKGVWRALGRPGVVLDGPEVVGTWRPRASGRTLRLKVEMWDGSDAPAGLDDEAERLVAHRDQRFGGFTEK